MKRILTIAAASGLALLMSAPAFAVQDGRYSNQTTVNRSVTQGRITMIERQGNQYRIQLDNGGYNYWVPLSTVRDQRLQVGDRVAVTGYGRADGMAVETISPLGFGPNGMYANGSVYGTVESVNRHLNYITVRDQNTGQRFKIDVRGMNTRRSVNVWRLRPGDNIVATGGWENNRTFNAATVNF